MKLYLILFNANLAIAIMILFHNMKIHVCNIEIIKCYGIIYIIVIIIINMNIFTIMK